MLTKPGYSSFAEAATHGLPVLCVRRDDWPESPWLLRWARSVFPVRKITPDQLATGFYEAELEQLLEATRPARLAPVDIAEATSVIVDQLCRHGQPRGH